MPHEVTWAPGAVGANTDFDLPTGSPAIDRVVAARVNSLTEGAPNTFTVTTPTPTRTDENTVQLDAALDAGDLLVLQYEPVGARVVP